jgi:hypothetical protein
MTKIKTIKEILKQMSSELNKNEEFNPILNNLTFKTTSYNKNTNIVFKDDSFITEYEGVITKIRVDEQKPPLHVGEFSMSQINYDVAKKFNADLKSYIIQRTKEDCYVDLIKLIKNKEFKIEDHAKTFFIHNLILRPDHRSIGVTEEFIEYIYRTFHRNDVKILALFKPMQLKGDDYQYFMTEKVVDVRIRMSDRSQQSFPARTYYQLEDLTRVEDIEFSEYKLFALANRCGFYRIGESYIFEFEPEKIIKRIQRKLAQIESGDLMVEDL